MAEETLYRVNGKRVRRDEFCRNGKGIQAGAPQVYAGRLEKIEAGSLAVSKEQIPEAKAYYESKGLRGVEWKADGTPVFTSTRSFERAARHYDARIGKRECDKGFRGGRRV